MFNVGDVVCVGDTYYTVMEVKADCIKPRAQSSGHTYGWHRDSLFTLVTPAGPPPSVLTGMTQFFKDHKEKKLNETSI